MFKRAHRAQRVQRADRAQHAQHAQRFARIDPEKVVRMSPRGLSYWAPLRWRDEGPQPNDLPERPSVRGNKLPAVPPYRGRRVGG
jgi:hypothetical protein